MLNFGKDLYVLGGGLDEAALAHIQLADTSGKRSSASTRPRRISGTEDMWASDLTLSRERELRLPLVAGVELLL